MHDEYSETKRAGVRRTVASVRHWWKEHVGAVSLFGGLCAYWVVMKIPDLWLKFRAAIADRRGRWRVVPNRNGIVQRYTDLELIIRTGGSFGGQRAVFITDLARLEDELLELREADAIRRREEAGRSANRRREAVAATKEKLKVGEQDECSKEE